MTKGEIVSKVGMYRSITCSDAFRNAFLAFRRHHPPLDVQGQPDAPHVTEDRVFTFISGSVVVRRRLVEGRHTVTFDGDKLGNPRRSLAWRESGASS
jgi:hypothetical protein